MFVLFVIFLFIQTISALCIKESTTSPITFQNWTFPIAVAGCPDGCHPMGSWLPDQPFIDELPSQYCLPLYGNCTQHPYSTKLANSVREIMGRKMLRQFYRTFINQTDNSYLGWWTGSTTSGHFKPFAYTTPQDFYLLGTRTGSTQEKKKWLCLCTN